jgi:hypothetical protein
VFDHIVSKPSTQTLMFPGRTSPLCDSEDVKREDRLSDSVGSSHRHSYISFLF